MLAVSSVGLAAGGHLVGGGQVEPVFLGLLVAAATVAAHAWLSRERGLLAIAATVIGLQVGVHLGLTVGHAHSVGPAMILTHAAAALLLAVLLRAGEARIYAAARRRVLRLLVALRVMAAGLPRPLATSEVRWEVACNLPSVWTPAPGLRRGPPALAL